jgi:hypothetical protein
MKTSTHNMIAILATVASLVVGDATFAKGLNSGSNHSAASSFKSSGSSFKSSGNLKTTSISNKATSVKTNSIGSKFTNIKSGSNNNNKISSNKITSNKINSISNKLSKNTGIKLVNNSNGKQDSHKDKHNKGCFSDYCFGCYSNHCCPSYGCYSDYCCYSPYCCESYCDPCYCQPSYCEQSCPSYGDQVAPVYGDSVAPVAGGQGPFVGGSQLPVVGQTANLGQAFEPFHSTYNTLPGDSFYTVSLKEYGTSANAGKIAQFNGMSEEAALVPGQQLVLPSIAADGTLSQSTAQVAQSFAPANNAVAAGSLPATPVSFTSAAGTNDDAARTKVPAGSTLLVDGQDFGSKAGSAHLRIGGTFLKVAVAEWTSSSVKVSLPKADRAGTANADLEIVRADGTIASRTNLEVVSAEEVASNN